MTLPGTDRNRWLNGTGRGRVKLIAFVAACDIACGKRFCRTTLNLRPVGGDWFSFIFDAAGINSRLTSVKEMTPANHAVLH